jgi:MFS family permease
VSARWRSRLFDTAPAFFTDAGFYVIVFALEYALNAEGASSRDVVLVFGIYTLAYAVLAPLLGRASDARGRRRSVLAGSALFALIALALWALIALTPSVDGTRVAARVGPLGVRGWAYLGIAGLAVANALFWPALQAQIGDRERDPEALGLAIRRFNVAWTTGKGGGFLAAGFLFAWAPGSCLPVGAAAGALVFLCLFFDRRDPVPQTPLTEAKRVNPKPVSLKRAFLLAALLANLVLWGSLATLKGLAPKLGALLAVGAPETGGVLFLALTAQGVGFALLGAADRWAYRPLLLAAALPVAGLGLTLVVLAGKAQGSGWTLLLAGAGVVGIGLAQAVTYAGSVFYSLDYDERRGVRAGIHEAVLGLGGGLSILGGVLADETGFLEAPLLLMVAIAVVGAFGVWWLLRKARSEADRKAS